jgi:hypothetical protein
MTKKSKQSKSFAVCIDNAGYPASLEAGKLYKIVPDAQAEGHGLLRVIDESGEDYGYSAERFFVLPVPQALEKVLRAISVARQPNPALKATSSVKASKRKHSRMPRRSRLTV